MKTRFRRTLSVLCLLSMTAGPALADQNHVLLAWNDLGMHCANQDFSMIVVLPPWNTVRAQLLQKSPEGPPVIVDSGVRLEYSIPGNTSSVEKTNFWDYAEVLFGLDGPLEANIGLTGKGLTGTMDAHDGYHEAAGIPVTPYPDDDLLNEHPYQLIHIEAWDEASNTLLASTDATIPVSNEIGCVSSGCHSNQQAILNGHSEEGPNLIAPVLCASCHASPALGTTGDPEAGFLSFRIHEKHAEVAGPANSIATCYKCHPGNNAQCLRGVMATGIEEPMICQDCHGTMLEVASSIEHQGRVPWADEPSCGECHGQNFAEEPGKLFRESRGHGGLYCSACHGSPHAIYPSREANDNLQSIALMGHAGTLGDCAVCHTTRPAGPGPHGLMAPPAGEVVLNIQRQAAEGGMRLYWNSLEGASSYRVYTAAEAWSADLFLLGETQLTQWSLPQPEGDQMAFYRVTALLP
jgi:hypothetical protein